LCVSTGATRPSAGKVAGRWRRTIARTVVCLNAHLILLASASLSVFRFQRSRPQPLVVAAAGARPAGATSAAEPVRRSRRRATAILTPGELSHPWLALTMVGEGRRLVGANGWRPEAASFGACLLRGLVALHLYAWDHEGAAPAGACLGGP